MGCHFLPQGIFLSQGSNLGLLHYRKILYHLSHQGSPYTLLVVVSLLSHVRLFCNLMNCSPPGFSDHGISQARILEWAAISFSRGFFRPRHIHTAAAQLLQSFLALCDPIDGSPPGSPIPGILQARTLEWVSISFSNA